MSGGDIFSLGGGQSHKFNCCFIHCILVTLQSYRKPLTQMAPLSLRVNYKLAHFRWSRVGGIRRAEQGRSRAREETEGEGMRMRKERLHTVDTATTTKTSLLAVSLSSVIPVLLVFDSSTASCLRRRRNMTMITWSVITHWMQVIPFH